MSVSPKKTAFSVAPEMDVLISCFRARRDASQTDRVGELLKARINWQALTSMSMRHRVLPLLYQQVESFAGDVPDLIRDELRDMYLRNAARNMSRVADAQKLAAIFRSRNIPVMFLRGPVLAESLYGDIASRQFSDLDLLVRSDNVRRVSILLAAEGLQPHFRLDERQEQALVRFRTERCFIRSSDQLTVDLHWRLLPPPFAFENDDALWSRGVQATVQGAEVQTLADEDVALFLCIHGAKHGWDQLALLCDLAEMVRARPKLNWDKILRRAQEAGKQRMILVGLRLMDELFGVPVPDPVRRVAEDRVARQLVDELKGRLLGNVGVQEGGGGGKWLIAWRMLKGCRSRLVYAADLMAVPTGIECERMKLPRPLFFLYYLLRLVRMVGKVFSRNSPRRES